jgi:hypothetical protein
MINANLAGIGARPRGPEPYFTGNLLAELLAYLSESGSTYEGAAKRFRCSKSTVEKTIYRLRRKQNKAPGPHESQGHGSDAG